VLEAFAATLQVTRVFERLGITYFVGGSIASSLHGLPRTTHDVDIVASITASNLAAFANALAGDFYVDEQMIRDTLASGECFNVIHLETMFKVDIFIARPNEKHQTEMTRRTKVELPELGATLDVASPEDIILEKLRWYVLGGEVSERQWNDVLGVLKISGPHLDLAYLFEKAQLRGLTELLRRAQKAAALQP